MENGIIGAGSSNGITHTATRGSVEVEEVYASNYQKAGTLTARLRQKISTVSVYPGKKAGSSMEDSLSPLEDYGFENNVYTSVENRMAFPNVAAGTTLEQAKALIGALPGACLYKVLSHEPILTQEQQYSITQGLKTKDDYANSQVTRYPDNAQTQTNGTAGKIIKDGDKVIYRSVFFSRTEKFDEDNRGGAVYVSPEIAAELAGTPMSARLVAEQSL